MLICQFCNKECKNNNSHVNHERTCPSNPNRNYKNGMTGKTAWNKGLTKDTNEIVAMYAKSIKDGFKAENRKLSGAAAWSYEQRRSHALKNNLGGYRENAGRSKKFKYVDSFGNNVCLQSTYELECAKILDRLKINWIRPKSIKYDTTRRYFPDFYLVDYDIYLDPKNDFLARKDQEKIQKVSDQNNIRVFILTNSMLNEDYIKTLVL